jgi:hypothetical protein
MNSSNVNSYSQFLLAFSENQLSSGGWAVYTSMTEFMLPATEFLSFWLTVITVYCDKGDDDNTRTQLYTISTHTSMAKTAPHPATNTFYFSLALQPPWVLSSNFQFHDHFTEGRTPWTSDQLVARPLP